MVKAAILEDFRKPFAVREVDLKPPEEGWARVRVRAVGVCGRDVVVWRGGFPNLKPPLILGHEVFGEYEGKPVGVYAGITSRECRERGLVEPLCGDYSILGENYPGGYAEEVYAPRENLVPLPDRDYEKYAASVCGVATIIHASRLAGVAGGSKILVTGATGGVGIHAIQYLVLLGAEVYATTRSPEKAETIEALGATPIIAEKGFGKKLAQKHGRVDAVIELVGAATINESMRALKPGGTLVLVGNTEGKPIEITRPAMLVMREYKIVGSAAFTLNEYRTAVKIVGRGQIKPFYKKYRLEEINKAYEDIVSGKIVGRAVLVL